MGSYSSSNRYPVRRAPTERDPRACEVCGVPGGFFTYDTAGKPHRVCALHADLTMDRRVAAREARNA